MVKKEELTPVYGWEEHYFLDIKNSVLYSLKNNKLTKIKPQARNGYLEVHLQRKINGKKIRAHHTLNRLILMTKSQSNPKGLDSHHLNQIRHDNREENLAWLSERLNRTNRRFKKNCKTEDLFANSLYLQSFYEKKEGDPF